MSEYLFDKKYGRNELGSTILLNEELRKEYNLSRYEMLLQAEGEELQRVKLQLLSEFVEIYKNDCDHATGLEPIGYYPDEKEKNDDIRLILLYQNFVYSLGSIYGGYHRELIRNGKIPLPEFHTYIVDYKGAFQTAYLDYRKTLFESGKASDEKPRMETSITFDGKVIEVPSPDQGGNRPFEAISATYIYPALLEHVFSLYLENSIIYQWLNGLGKKQEQLTDNERILFETQKRYRQEGRGMISGNRRRMLQTIWDIGEKYNVLKDSGGMRLVMCGKNEGDSLTLGDMIGLAYTKTRIRPEYQKVLSLLFGRKYLNLRNKIAHGDYCIFNYHHAGFVAVMHQMLTDIITGDVFIPSKG